MGWEWDCLIRCEKVEPIWCTWFSDAATRQECFMANACRPHQIQPVQIAARSDFQTIQIQLNVYESQHTTRRRKTMNHKKQHIEMKGADKEDVETQCNSRCDSPRWAWMFGTRLQIEWTWTSLLKVLTYFTDLVHTPKNLIHFNATSQKKTTREPWQNSAVSNVFVQRCFWRPR